jgi:DNA-binding MarR family transcriptional regulator/N-acetylglutamate synthase-like GNAT family acetyltransferase
MTDLQDYGGLLLGSRLKRLSESLYSGVDEVYRAHGVDLSSRSFPILFLLRDDGPLGVTELAGRLGQSHPAVIQMSRKLLAEGVVAERHDPSDDRRRLLVLTKKGRALMERMEPIWRAIVGAVDTLAGTARGDLMVAVTALEHGLAERGFAARIHERIREEASQGVAIIPFEARYRDEFKRLNLEWLETYFSVEPIDHEVLSQPEKRILERDGFIFFARYGDEIVGTCALIRHPRGRFELSKMAVTERYRRLRIGYQLLRAAIAQFRASGAKQLFLESSSKLPAALRLYEANGFRHAPRPKSAIHYRRSDVYMVYQEDSR